MGKQWISWLLWPGLQLKYEKQGGGLSLKNSSSQGFTHMDSEMESTLPVETKKSQLKH